MKFYLLPGAGLLLALTLSHTGPVHADAAVAERIRALSLRIEQDPDNQSLRLQRSMAYFNNNQTDLALAEVRTAEAVGDPVNAAFTHGALLYKMGDYATAQPYFDRYLKAYPGHQGALKYRARLLRDTGQNRKAIADFETLLALSDSLDPGYYIDTARLMADLPDRGTDEALSLLDARVAQRGPIISLQQFAIELERERGNFQGAIERMAHLDQRLKATPQWQVEVAELLLLAEQPEEALPYLALAQEQLKSARATPAHRELSETVHRLQVQARQAEGVD
jgi:tetratricopeptide (TPR) repeat protein